VGIENEYWFWKEFPMKTCRFAIALAILFHSSTIVPSARAGSIIPGLYNTGVALDGTLLPDNAVDPHYFLIQSPDTSFPGPNTYTLLNTGQFPLGGWWTPNASISKWITPDPNNYVSCETGNAVYHTTFAPGDYTYRTTFLLPDTFNPLTDAASIMGMWASDNTGLEILIKGVRTGNFHPYGLGGTDPYSWSTFSSFSINNGFQPGLNTLDFEIEQDGGSPTGLHVQMTGEYTSTPVREPSHTLLLGFGIAGVLDFGWRYSHE
jgi:hypothetical protein